MVEVEVDMDHLVDYNSVVHMRFLVASLRMAVEVAHFVDMDQLVAHMVVGTVVKVVEWHQMVALVVERIDYM
jgi:hypothetical protein